MKAGRIALEKIKEFFLNKITIYDNTTTLETKVYIKNNKLLYKSNKTSLWLENFIEIFNN
ncbi:MAG: hypothetical protein ACRC1R_00375 [Cetobacterium sp.]|uniref:hypothetical protein n=1 Tax=Cetobacterium sp. TaxID=2071632 RepID=UPI003F311A3A